MVRSHQVKEAILRAADWLESNPDKHIFLHLARAKNGYPTNPFDANATCFCALGRTIFEIGGRLRIYSGDDPNSLYQKLVEHDLFSKQEVRDIWTTNDDTSEDLSESNRHRAILVLRKFAE